MSRNRKPNQYKLENETFLSRKSWDEGVVELSSGVKYSQMKRLYFCTFVLLALLVSCNEGGTSFTNPLRTTDGELLRVADPCVTMFEGSYYLSASTATGLESWKSADLQTWEKVGPIAIFPEDDPLKSCIWASEVHNFGGKYYLTYSGLNPATSTLDTNLGVGETPFGPFTLIAAPLIHLEGKNAIDANIFVDDDGQAYLYFSENGSSSEYAAYGALRQARLKPDFSGIEGEIMPVNEEYPDWERLSIPRGVRCNEGSTVFKHGDTYYMTYSANETHMGDYGVGVQTAPTPLGPWTKADYNPILYSSPKDGPLSEGGLPVIDSPGHNSIILDKKGDPQWIIYHRHAPEVTGYPSNDRVTCINRIWIDKNGKVRTDFTVPSAVE